MGRVEVQEDQPASRDNDQDERICALEVELQTTWVVIVVQDQYLIDEQAQGDELCRE